MDGLIKAPPQLLLPQATQWALGTTFFRPSGAQSPSHWAIKQQAEVQRRPNKVEVTQDQ
jgi:hypothetical protein